jgi:hypothetical protein
MAPDLPEEGGADCIKLNKIGPFHTFSGGRNPAAKPTYIRGRSGGC